MNKQIPLYLIMVGIFSYSIADERATHPHQTQHTVTHQPHVIQHPVSQHTTPKPPVHPTPHAPKPKPTPTQPVHQTQPPIQSDPVKKSWTMLVYLARDNSLYDAGTLNIDWLKSVDNPYVNILVFDSFNRNGMKASQKLVIKHNSIQLVETLPYLDSGSATTFKTALDWAISSFPSEHLAVVAWDHGSGILNRSASLLRGFCYDDTTNHHLDDMNIQQVLQSVVQARNGNPIDIFGFDACLMASAEMTAALAPYVRFVVASQQTIPDEGWYYLHSLNWQKNLTPEEFCKKIVADYGDFYLAGRESVTLAAIDTSYTSQLQALINRLSAQLTDLMNQSTNPDQIRQQIAACAPSYFDEPTYMDIVKFCTMAQQSFATNSALVSTLNDLASLIGTMVIARTASSDLSFAGGLSLYMPQHFVEPSYAKTWFAQHSSWKNFIQQYTR